MGGICCCCCDDEEYFHHRERRTRTVPGGSDPRTANRQNQQNPNSPPRSNQCKICGRTIDSSLIDGHEESCRAQARRRMRDEQHQQQQQNNNSNIHSDTTPLRPNANDDSNYHSNFSPSSSTATTTAAGTQSKQQVMKDIVEDDPDHQCVICLDNKKVVAILPCAHLCCCFECSKMIDSCPLCRGAKESLLIINENVGKCRVCQQFIAPVYLDSHQEVCRMRMRDLRRKLRDEQEKSDANLMMRAQSSGNQTNNDLHHDHRESNSNLHPQSSSNLGVASADGMCLNCLVKKREKFCLPCGHPFCDECSRKSANCPVCLRTIAARITVYD